MMDEKEKRVLKEFTKFLIDKSSEDGTLNIIDLTDLLFEFTENTNFTEDNQ